MSGGLWRLNYSVILHGFSYYSFLIHPTGLFSSAYLALLAVCGVVPWKTQFSHLQCSDDFLKMVLSCLCCLVLPMCDRLCMVSHTVTKSKGTINSRVGTERLNVKCLETCFH